MYSCIPVISDQTPWKNLEQKNIGFDIKLNEPEKYVAVFDYLAKMEVCELNKLSENAFEFAQSIINNNQLKEDYHNLFNSKV